MDSAVKPLGFAKIKLKHLNFCHEYRDAAQWEVGYKEKKSLVESFRKTNCRRNDVKNFIDIAVTYNAALEYVSTPGEDLPELNFDVLALQGLRRKEAGVEFLNITDRWWPVRLYRDDLPKRSLRELSESYSHENSYKDGHIFRMIRMYYRAGDRRAEDRWWARLSATKSSNLKQLGNIDHFLAAFDDLLDYPGLWAPIKLGSFHRFLSVKCNEEILSYLKHIKQIWMAILGDLHPSSLDESGVKALEGLCPQSDIDWGSICKSFTGGEHQIFRSVRDTTDRENLLRRIKSTNCLIPSLWTLLELVKLFEPPCVILKELVGQERLEEHKTIQRALHSCFAGQQTALQVDEYSICILAQSGSTDDCFQLAYAQLWAFCLREFTDMTLFGPLLEARNKKNKPPPKPVKPSFRKRLARLATAIGFQIIGIEADTSLDNWSPRTVMPATGGQHLDVKRRYGRPLEDDYWANRDELYLHLLHRYAVPVNFAFVYRDMFAYCFGVTNNLDQMQRDAASSTRRFAVPVNENGISIDTQLQNAALQKALRDKEAHCINLQSTLEETRSSLFASQNTEAYFRDIVTQLKSKIDESEETVGRQSEELGGRNTQLAAITEELKELRKAQIEAEAVRDIDTNSLIETRNRLKSIELIINEKEKLLGEANQSLETLRKAQIEAEAAINIDTNSLTETRNRLESMELIINKKDKSLDEANQSLETLRKAQIEAEAVRDTDTNSLIETRNRLESIELIINEKEKSLGEANQSLETLRKAQIEAEAAIKTRDKQLDEAKQRLEELKQEAVAAKDFEVTAADWLKTMQITLNEKDKLQSETISLIAEKENTRKDIESMTKENEKLQEAIMLVEKQLEGQVSKAKETEAVVQRAAQRTEVLQKELAAAQTRLGERQSPLQIDQLKSNLVTAFQNQSIKTLSFARRDDGQGILVIQTRWQLSGQDNRNMIFRVIAERSASMVNYRWTGNDGLRTAYLEEERLVAWMKEQKGWRFTDQGSKRGLESNKAVETGEAGEEAGEGSLPSKRPRNLAAKRMQKQSTQLEKGSVLSSAVVKSVSTMDPSEQVRKPDWIFLPPSL